MKWLLILVILFGAVDAAPEAEESLGKKIKKILAPTPTPTPARKHRQQSAKKPTATPSPTASPRRKKATPTPTAAPKSKSKRKSASPTPTPEPEESPSATPSETPVPSSAERPSGKKAWPNVSLSPDQIAGYENNPPSVRQILDAGLMLTKQNLGYTYGSADPKNGGMDCSGFIYHVLQQNGFPDVPRDSSQQYVWVESRGTSGNPLDRKSTRLNSSH